MTVALCNGGASWLHPRIVHFKFFQFTPKSVRATDAEPRMTALLHALVTDSNVLCEIRPKFMEKITRLIRLVISADARNS